ncbi:MAG: hypothetical protein EP332_06800 [Bacteroidetes bacterium]|nr:MAG: hypothetical protein EP332_06800 [Bacteroidota bacterium]
MSRLKIPKHSGLWLFLLAVLSRLPQLLSPYQMLDGDEVVVGLMANHLIHTDEWPLYYWGQTYGFAFLEVAFIGLFYQLVGYGQFAVQLAMVVMWSLGIAFFYKALKTRDTKSWAPILFSLVLIFMPSWAIWSLKARGGYVSAFFLGNLLLYLLFWKGWNSRWKELLIGLLLLLLFESQSMWLAGLLPYLAYRFWRDKNWKAIPLQLLGFAIPYLLLKWHKAGLIDFWHAEIFPLRCRDWASLETLPQEVFAHFSGSYLFSSFRDPSWAAAAVAWTFCTLLLLAFGIAFWRTLRNRFKLTEDLAILLSLVGSIAYMLLIPGIHPRYLLPLSGYLLVALFLLSHNKLMKVQTWTSLAYLPIGAIALLGYTRFSYDDPAAFHQMMGKLKADKINAVWSEGGQLQWQIMFYSEEEIIARYRNREDRYMPFLKEVQHRYEAKVQHSAIVGKLDTGNVPDDSAYVHIADTYFYLANPSKEELKARNFEFDF